MEAAGPICQGQSGTEGGAHCPALQCQENHALESLHRQWAEAPTGTEEMAFSSEVNYVFSPALQY